MNKILMTSPLGAQVYIEADDPTVFREALRDLVPHLSGSNEGFVVPRSGSQAVCDRPGDGEEAVPSGATEPLPEPVPTASAEPPPVASSEAVNPQAAEPPETGQLIGTETGTAGDATLVGNATAGEPDFVAFCQGVDPHGDMRKVVVAAEGARRYLQVSSVDVGLLSRLAGWNGYRSGPDTTRSAASGAVSCSAKTLRQLKTHRPNPNPHSDLEMRHGCVQVTRLVASIGHSSLEMICPSTTCAPEHGSTYLSPQDVDGLVPSLDPGSRGLL